MLNEVSSLAQLYFGRLSDKEFVYLCRNILDAKKFVDLEILEGPGDRGNDIIGNEILKTALGTEKRRCLIQCKHYIKSGKTVSDKEIRTARGSMSQRNCKTVLIVTSTTLSSPAKHTVRHFREEEGILFNYWDAEYLIRILREDPKLREVARKLGIGIIYGAEIGKIHRLYMNAAVFYGAYADPISIKFDKLSYDKINSDVIIEKKSQFRLQLSGLRHSLNLEFHQYGGVDYIDDRFWQKYAFFSFKKERLVVDDLLIKYVSSEHKKRGKPKRFPLDLSRQRNLIRELTTPPLESIYGLQWEISKLPEIYESVRESREVFCRLVSKYLSDVGKNSEWFLTLFSNPIISSYISGAPEVRSSVIILPEHQTVFGKKVDNDCIGLPGGSVDEKEKWLFGLAPSFKEYSYSGKIDPDKEIESHVSITPKKELRYFQLNPYTFGDLTNIPDLRARWIFHKVFYLRPSNLEDKAFIMEVLSSLDKGEDDCSFEEIREKVYSIAKIDIDTPSTIRKQVSETVLYVGGDPWTTSDKRKEYCMKHNVLSYDVQGSVFLLISLSFRTKSLAPSYILSEKTSFETDRILRKIEKKISKVYQVQFDRKTMQRSNVLLERFE